MWWQENHHFHDYTTGEKGTVVLSIIRKNTLWVHTEMTRSLAHISVWNLHLTAYCAVFIFLHFREWNGGSEKLAKFSEITQFIREKACIPALSHSKASAFLPLNAYLQRKRKTVFKIRQILSRREVGAGFRHSRWHHQEMQAEAADCTVTLWNCGWITQGEGGERSFGKIFCSFSPGLWWYWRAQWHSGGDSQHAPSQPIPWVACHNQEVVSHLQPRHSMCRGFLGQWWINLFKPSCTLSVRVTLASLRSTAGLGWTPKNLTLVLSKRKTIITTKFWWLWMFDTKQGSKT